MKINNFDYILSKERIKKIINPHMLISGYTVTDVSFTSKILLNKAIQNPNNKVVIIDVLGDYKELCTNIHPEGCKIANVLNDIYQNPLRVKNYKEENIYWIHQKFEFLVSLFNLVMKRELNALEKAYLDAACKHIKNKHNTTLKSLCEALKEVNLKGTQEMRDVLYPYLDIETFNNSKTIINSNIAYINLSSYEEDYKEIVYLFAIDYTYQQMINNSKVGKHTFVCIPYLDDMNNSLKNYLSSIVKRARPFGGILLFTTHKLKESYCKFEHIFQNIPTLLLLKSSDDDLKFVKEFLGFAENFKNYYSLLDYNNEFLLIERDEFSICKKK